MKGAVRLSPSRLGVRAAGVATLRFVLDHHGRVGQSSVVRTTGERALDGFALNAIRGAPPFPRAPLARPGNAGVPGPARLSATPLIEPRRLGSPLHQ
ncbi:energy transducer TonB [Brevundimonas sp.]